MEHARLGKPAHRQAVHAGPGCSVPALPCCALRTGACTVTMNANQTVTATFNLGQSTLPQAGSYQGTCGVELSAVTCCANGDCVNVPRPPPTQSPFSFVLAPGTSLAQFITSVCGILTPALSVAGCASESCSMTASTPNSAQFTDSCTVASAGCTPETVTQTCSATQQ